MGLGHRSQSKGVVTVQCARVVLEHRPAEGVEATLVGGQGVTGEQALGKVGHLTVAFLQGLSHCPS